MHPEVAGHGHETTHCGLEPIEDQGRLTLGHLQRSGHGGVAHDHRHHPIHIRPGVVEGDADRFHRGRGEALTQVQLRCAGGLQRQLTIAADRQRHRRVAHTSPEDASGLQAGRGIVRDHQQFIGRRRTAADALHPEITRQRDEPGHLGLQTIDHHRCLAIADTQRRTHGRRPHGDRECAIQHIGSSVVESHTDRGG